MAAFVAIVLGAACVFLVYALVQFGREIRLLRSPRNRGAALVMPFRGMPESRYSESASRSKVTVLPVSGMASSRDVA
ncbi:MAG: hypothetical protein WB460_06550 [Candidatus Acidiferrales bacterium]